MISHFTRQSSHHHCFPPSPPLTTHSPSPHSCRQFCHHCTGHHGCATYLQPCRPRRTYANMAQAEPVMTHDLAGFSSKLFCLSHIFYVPDKMPKVSNSIWRCRQAGYLSNYHVNETGRKTEDRTCCRIWDFGQGEEGEKKKSKILEAQLQEGIRLNLWL